MSAPPEIFDPSIVTMRRKRSTPEALFLHRLAADIILEKLQEVNRTFKAPLIIGPFPEIWQELGFNAQIMPDTDVLPIPPAKHDLIIHFMALHHMNDPLGQMIQSLRGLKPDGMFNAVCFGEDTLADLRIALTTAEAQVCGGVSPRIAPMTTVQEYGALLQRAGFALPVVDQFRQRVQYQSPLKLMHDLRHMGESNAMLARKKTFTRRAVIQQAAKAYPTENGAYPAKFDLVFLSGWANHDSQQKPLRPGSAKMSLMQALAPDGQIPQD